MAYFYTQGQPWVVNALAIANPIYQEVIRRALNKKIEAFNPGEYITRLDNEAKLDWSVIWENFLEFWREHAEALMVGTNYLEIAPHLVLMAYLQRIANSKGEILREYAIGRGRIDLLVKWAERQGAISDWGIFEIC